VNLADADQLDLLVQARFPATPAARLSHYYRLVRKWNPRLHLTTILQPQAFFARHLVESALVSEAILPGVDQVWDIGSGAGIPGLIVAILQPVLPVHLVESNRKKAIFLEEAGAELGLTNLTVVAHRFESLPVLPSTACMTVRAIEEMARQIPALVRLGSGGMQMILLGALSLEAALHANLPGNWRTDSTLLPDSTNRYLIQAQGNQEARE
jgi:16S rRNA (guanine527-N7)-methyltransferase